MDKVILVLIAALAMVPKAHASVDMGSVLQCRAGVDDSSVLQATLNTRTEVLDFTSLGSRHCYLNRAIAWPSGVGVVQGDAVLDFSGAPMNTDDITITGPANNYLGRTVKWDGVHIVGNGTGTGLTIAVPSMSFEHLTVHENNFGVKLGNNAYGLNFEAPNLFNSHDTAFDIPPGLSNAGEQIVIHGGSIFNSSHGLFIGGGRVILEGTSIDGISAVPVTMNAQCAPGQAAALTMVGAHVEEFTNPTGWIWLTGCNTYSYIDIDHTEFFANAGTNLPLVNNTETWAWGKVRDSFFSGFSAVTATGVGASNIKFCHNTSGGNHPQDNVPDSSGC